MTSSTSAVTRVSIVLIAVVITGAALHWLQNIFAPLALSAFMMMIITGVSRRLKDRATWLPERAVVPVVMLVIVLLFGGMVYVLAVYARVFAGEIVLYAPRLNGVIATLGHEAGVQVPPTVNQLITQANPSHFVGPALVALQHLSETSVFVLVYLIFFFISRATFWTKAERIFTTRRALRRAEEVICRISLGVERYLLVQTMIALILAVVAMGLLAAVGLKHVLFWGIFMFVATYIPILGAVVKIGVPPVFALLQFGADWRAGALAAGLWLIHFIEGNLVTPRLQGEALNVDPVVVLLALSFWGAVWGVTGMFLSTPLAVVMIIVLAQFDGGRWLAVLMSRDGRPERFAAEAGAPAPTEAKTAPA